MKPLISALPAIVLLVACGVGAGPELGDFPAIEKAETDPPFTLTAPSSRSPVPFTFTSSNPAVATISGAVVTIHGLGQSTITAAQSGNDAWGPTSKSTTLTVSPACPSGQVRVNGTCTVAPTCTAPATPVGDQCVAPAITAATLTRSPLTWRGTAHTDTWAHARHFCEDSVIDKTTGWRLPTQDELSTLFTSRATANQGWSLGATWSVTVPGSGQAGRHVTVDLAKGRVEELDDTAVAYVSCVR